MPDPNTPGAPNGSTTVDLRNAPGADINLDDLFPIEPESLSATTPQGTTPPSAPQTPSAADFFLKAGKSVYKTSEDAARGVEHKDTLIDRYRSYLATKGIDPDTLQEKPKPEVRDPNSQFTYLDDPNRYYKDLSDAAGKNDAVSWAKVQRQYNTELMAQEFQGLAPLIGEVSRQRAIRKVSEEAPDFGQFLGSEDYTSTLDRQPLLKRAIESAEANFQQADQLPELYQLAYLTSQGRKVRTTSAPVTVNPVIQNPPAARPTMASGTLTPPPPQVGGPQGHNPEAQLRSVAGSKAGLQQLIKDMEARGIDNADWSTLR